MTGKKSKLGIFIYILVIAVFLGFAYAADLATTVISERIPMPRKATVVIDAGHGGVDGGAISCSGIPESKLNLQICLRLNDLFHLLGYQTRMIRTEDISVYTTGETIAAKKVSDLRRRVKIVSETENALLLSIHQNTFSDNRYAGAQVFYTDNAASKELAQRLQEEFIQTLNPGSTRTAKKAEGVYLMQHIECTGILVECGFLSNSQEETLLRNADYQKKICSILAVSVSRFLTK